MIEEASKYGTEIIDLSTVNGFSWKLSCINDPQNAQVLPVGTKCDATVPGTLLDDLKTCLPDPFLFDNNLLPVFSKLEKASFSLELNFDLKSAISFSSAHTSACQTLLVFEGLDTCATVFLNGNQILSSENAFQKHTVALPVDTLTPIANVLRIDFASIHTAINKRPKHTYKEWNDPVGGISRVRTPQYVAGWDWGPRLLGCGIARPVQLVFIPIARVIDVAFLQSFPEQNSDGCPTVVEVPVTANVAIHRQAPSISAESKLILNSGEKNTDVAAPSTCVCLERDVETEQSSAGELWNGDIECEDLNVVRFRGVIKIEDPKLWWPNGMGPQNLYAASVCLTVNESGTVHFVDSWKTEIGLRDLQLIQEPTPGLAMHDANLALKSIKSSENDDGVTESVVETDDGKEDDEFSESLVFAVNGRRFFAKGANYIHPKVLHATTTAADYEDVLQSAQDAHMNMLRVWGGGVYEKEVFYEACNRLGILLWHDFMFSCSLYPGDDEFIESCKREAKYQVSRLRNHPCMALWCGNNELEQVPHEITQTKETKAAYDRLFYDVLRKVVNSDPCQIPYWPCSPHNPQGYEHGFNNKYAGDTHFWDVWHARHPVTAYLQHTSRFCSEFGMQSYLSEAGARRFAGYDSGVLNPFGPVLEAHQKNASGNMIIMEYCQRVFRMPKSSYPDISYQSQLNQLHCMRVGVEHFRRSWPYCAGAMYWQLNDCWPCFSWSSIEYGGNWKALHYGAKKFYSPLLLTLVHHGSESVGIGNITKLSDDTGLFSAHAVYDGRHPTIDVIFNWAVVDITSGAVRMEATVGRSLHRDTSVPLTVINAQQVEGVRIDPFRHVVRASVVSRCGTYRSSTVGWFCSPRLYDLPHPRLTMQVVHHEISDSSTRGTVQIESDAFAPWCEVWFDNDDKIGRSLSRGAAEVTSIRYTPPPRTRFSDNFLDLFAGELHTIDFEIEKEMAEEEIKTILQCRALPDSYAA